MTRKLLSTASFKDAAKDGSKPDGVVFRLATGDPEAVGDETARTERFVFSDNTIDLAGDSIAADGWEMEDFNKNPVALFSHLSWEPPIGRALNVGIKGNKLIGDIQFATAEVYAFADTIYRLVKGKFLRAVSVGFMPLEWKFISTQDRPYGIDFLRQKLLEISVCSVPCNPNALSEARSKGIDTEPLREWAEKVLDTGGCVMVPRSLLEDTFRQAKTPRSVRRQYLAKAAAPSWKMGASSDLPLCNTKTWDGPAAAARMFEDASFDSETPDVTKAARGFLIHDAANPTLRSSYKLPFADIIDGKLQAVLGGVEAAAANATTSKTDAPEAVLAEATSLVEAYQDKFDELDEEIDEPEELDPALKPGSKAGRRISSTNEALLKKAMDHHASATQCLKDVLDSNAAGDATEEESHEETVEEVTAPVPIPTPPVELSESEKVKQRIREAQALRDSAKV